MNESLEGDVELKGRTDDGFGRFDRRAARCSRAVSAGVLTAPRSSVLPSRGNYGLIALFNMLEHIPAHSPVSSVYVLFSRLSSEGAVLARALNGDSPFGLRHHYNDLTYVMAFGEFNLKELASLTGLKLAALGAPPWPWPSQQGESRILRFLRHVATPTILNSVAEGIALTIGIIFQRSQPA